jgi:hypothetical protein
LRVFHDRRLREVELAFLNAPFSPDGWMAAIQRLADVTGSRMAQLCGGGTGPGLDFNFFSDDVHDPHRHLTNPALYGSENWRINCVLAARTIQDERHYAAYRAAVPSSFYDDAVSDLDLPFGCQTALMLDANGLFGLALLRSSKNGPCSAETLERFRFAARQAHRAVRAQIALGEEAAELMVANVAGRRERTILLDRFTNLLAMTDSAELLFDEPGVLALSGLRLRLAHPEEDRALHSACSRLLNSGGLAGPMLHDMVIGRCATHPQGRWRALVVRLGTDGFSLNFEPRLALTLTPLGDDRT